jgi:hypothetical protein
VCADLLINEHIDISRRTVHVEHPLRQVRYAIQPIAWKGHSPEFAAWKGFEEANFFRDVHRGFIAAGYGNGGVGLPSLSSSFSFPELLVGFPGPTPPCWPYFSCECMEG